MSMVCFGGNNQNQQVWKLIEDKFDSLSSQDEFWANTLRQLPVQAKSGMEIKDQVVSFYHKVRNGFEDRCAIFKKTKKDLCDQSMSAVNEEHRLFRLWLDSFGQNDSSRDQLLLDSEAHKAIHEEAMRQLEDLRPNLVKDPITKLFTHCILVAHGKAHLSRLYNADWQKYFPKE